MMNYPLIKTLRNLIAFWELTTLMAGRDMRALNRGSLIGIGWLVLRPMLQVSIYVVIIGYVFSLRLPNDVGNFGYVLHVLSGIVVWQFMQKLFEDAPSLIRDKTEFLRQVVYPMETLPVTSAMIGIPALGIGIVVFIVIAALDQVLNVSILALPIGLFFLVLFVIGGSWILMIAGVFFRDLKDIVGVIMSVLFYVSPVLLAESMVKPEVWSIIQLSPFAHVIIVLRDMLMGTFHVMSWYIFGIMSVVLFVIGGTLVQVFNSRIQNQF